MARNNKNTPRQGHGFWDRDVKHVKIFFISMILPEQRKTFTNYLPKICLIPSSRPPAHAMIPQFQKWRKARIDSPKCLRQHKAYAYLAESVYRLHKESVRNLPQYFDATERRLVIQSIIVGAVVWVYVFTLKQLVHRMFEWVIRLEELGFSNLFLLFFFRTCI